MQIITIVYRLIIQRLLLTSHVSRLTSNRECSEQKAMDIACQIHCHDSIADDGDRSDDRRSKIQLLNDFARLRIEHIQIAVIRANDAETIH